MAETADTNESLTMIEIMQLARMYSEGVVPDEYKQTLPIPAFEDGEGSVSVYYSPVQRMQSGNNGAVLFPAEYRVVVTYPEGKFKFLESLGPESHPDEVHPDGSIGLHRLTVTMEEFETQKNLLFELYDELTEPFFNGGVAEEFSKSRERFMGAFRLIHEEPFLFYYRSRGREFFDWVRGN